MALFEIAEEMDHEGDVVSHGLIGGFGVTATDGFE